MTLIVSDVTASLGSRMNKSGPFYYAGEIYVILRQSPGFACYNATYTESGGFGTFAELDGANRPNGNVITSSLGTFVMQDPDDASVIHCVNYGTVSGGDYAVEYSKFDADVSGGTWTEADTVAVSAFTLDIGNGSAMIAKRSDGDLVIVYQGPNTTTKGTDYARIFYTVHQGTGWGDASGAVDDGGSVSYINPTIVMDDADNCHIIYYDGTNHKHKTLNSSNSLSSAQTVGSSVYASPKPALKYHNNAGSHDVYFYYRNTGGGAYYQLIDDGTPGTPVQMTSTTVYTQGSTWEDTMELAIRISNGDLYFVFTQSTDRDDYYTTDASGSWSSDAAFSGAGQTIQDQDAEIIVTDEGATVLLTVFQDSGASEMEIFAITIEAGSSGISGSLNVTQASQTVAGTGTVDVDGSLSVTQAENTLAGTGTVDVAGSLSVAQDSQTLVGTGTVDVAGSASLAQDSQTVAGTGTVGIAGSASLTQDDQTLAGSGTVAIAGAASVTQDAQTLAGTGTVSISGALSITQDGNTLAGTGTVDVVGTLSITQDDQTVSASGSVGDVISGSLSVTQDAQTLAGTGTVDVAGSLGVSQDSQTLAGTGTVDVEGVLNVTQDSQTLAGSGSVGDVISGSLSVIQDSQTISASGTVDIDGSLSVTQAGDTLASTGSVLVVGTLMITQDAQTLVGTGIVDTAASVVGDAKGNPVYENPLVSFGAAGAVTYERHDGEARYAEDEIVTHHRHGTGMVTHRRHGNDG